MTEKVTLLQQLQLLGASRFSASSRASSGLQAQAWDAFVSKGFPSKDEEAFRYLSLRELHESSFCLDPRSVENFSIEPSSHYRIVLIDGKLSPHHSFLEGIQAGVVAISLSEAMNTYGPLLKGKASKILEEGRPLSLLNYALHEEGLFLYIPPNIVLDKKIEIMEIYTAPTASMYFPRLSIYIGKNAQAAFQMGTRMSASHFINRVMDVYLDKGSHVSVETSMVGAQDAFYFDQVSIDLKQDAVGKYRSCDVGGLLCRQEFTFNLLEENGQMTLQGLSILKGKAQSHQYVTVNHKAPRCTSSQHFKGVLFDRAMLSFEGKIAVDSIAQETQAYQLSNHLLMSSSARAYSKPNLEIFADDVKASHGATVAQLRPEEKFYLQTRGLSVEEAKNMLVTGFCRELLTKMQKDVQETMLQQLEQGLYVS